MLSAFDQHLFAEGRHLRLYEKLGAQVTSHDRDSGTSFAVWAPNARAVSVVGDFNGWEAEASALERQPAGIWRAFLPCVGPGAAYQYEITSAHQGYRTRKADPVGFRQEMGAPGKSLVWDLEYEWRDEEWMSDRGRRNALGAAISIYQVDLESWRRVPEEGNRVLSYREIAPRLAAYVSQHGFTHVQLLPVMEHPAGSGRERQVSGYFAAGSGAGTPQDLMFLIEHLHQRGLGVVLEWVPAHFPDEEHGLGYFDGTRLYKHGSWTAEWPGQKRSYTFDFSRGEVRSFLLSSAMFWLERYHADGLSMDAVDAMLYLDFGRKAGEWIANEHGGRENLEGIAFVRQLNEEIYRYFPEVQTFADERDGWPLVSRPTYDGGLGFGFKLDNEFRTRTLGYWKHDPFFRKFHHGDVSYRALQEVSENLVLPLSDQEASTVSLLAQMPGDEWQRFANLRLLFGYQFLQPGKKLMFMGAEFAQWQGWNPRTSLDWHLAPDPKHGRIQRWVGDLNHCYRSEKALHENDYVPVAFEPVDFGDSEQSTLSWLRRDLEGREVLLVVCNFTPVVRHNFRLGVRRGGRWRELLNSDAEHYGGSGQGNFGGVTAAPFSSHGLLWTVVLTLPPLAIVIFKHEGGKG